MKKKWDALWVNANIMTCEGHQVEIIENGALAIQDGKIAWLGILSESPQTLAEEIHDVHGYCLTPGLIDCHTHVIYAGNRAHEFVLRLQGLSYEAIAEKGGGIFSTVKATRDASFDALLKLSLERVRALQQSGVTTIEIKTGYGLNWDTELKMLNVADEIAKRLDISVVKTFLAAHAIPPEYQHDRAAYVDLICNEMIPRIARPQPRLADAIDIFSDKIAFNLQETEQIFKAARQHHLAIKCHAEQLSETGSATLAAHYDALSCDHLEYLSDQGVKTLKESGHTVAVLLPGAFYYLREKKHPPIEALREHRIPIAIASDCNPGTSPILSLQIIMNMACVLFELTPEEALLGVTKYAAMALGRDKITGTLTVGKDADLAVWSVNELAQIVYYLGNNPLHQLVKNGKIIFQNE